MQCDHLLYRRSLPGAESIESGMNADDGGVTVLATSDLLCRAPVRANMIVSSPVLFAKKQA